MSNILKGLQNAIIVVTIARTKLRLINDISIK